MADTINPNAQSGAVEGIQPQGVGQIAPQTSASPGPATDPKLEAIIKREKQIYRQMREIKAREEALKQRESQINPQEYLPKKRLQEDPLATLQELGLSYEKLTEMQLQQPNAMDPTIRALAGEIKNLKEQLSQTSTAQQQAQEAQYEQVKTQMLSDAKSFTSGNPEFELVDKWEAHDLIVDEIEKEFNRTQREMGRGIIISMETAAKRVEDNLFKEVERALDFNKIKNYKKPVAADTVTPQEQQTQGEKLEYTPSKRGAIPYKVSSVRTLTNTMTQDSPSKREGSWEAKRAAAIAKLTGQKV